MSFIAVDNSNSNYKKVPQGVFIGRCYSLIDLGTQISTGNYPGKSSHKIMVGWELFGEDEDGNPLTFNIDGKNMPMTIGKFHTISLHENAALRIDLTAWRGKDFTEEEAKAFDVSKLLGAYCMVNVKSSETNGKVYSTVAGLTPLPRALKNSKPAPCHKNVVFDLDNPDMDVFSSFGEKMKELIKQSPEWANLNNKNTVANKNSKEDLEDLPF